MRVVHSDSDEGHSLRDQYLERIWCYSESEDDEEQPPFFAGTGIPYLPLSSSGVGPADTQEDAVMMYEEENPFDAWAREIHDVQIEYE